VLIPDFQGSERRCARCSTRSPTCSITTPRPCRGSTGRRARRQVPRALELLDRARHYAPDIPTKTGLMVGLGETWDEIVDVLATSAQVDCQIPDDRPVPPPSVAHLPMERYYTPDEFRELKRIALDLGFGHVESGPAGDPIACGGYHARYDGSGGPGHVRVPMIATEREPER
jgi:lipoic acid synthetase